MEHKSGNICEMRKIDEKLLCIGGGLEELSNWAKEMPPNVSRASGGGGKKPKIKINKPVLPKLYHTKTHL